MVAVKQRVTCAGMLEQIRAGTLNITMLESCAGIAST